MPIKLPIPKLWPTAVSFDGRKYSAYPTGNKPSGYVTAPTLIDTDIRSGSLTNFENNKGCYLRLFGYNLGRQVDLGTALGARVYLRDPLGDNLWHEVDNYRALNVSRVYTSHQIIRIIVQVGSLGGGMVAGRTLDVKITVNGVDTNVLSGWFTVQNGGDCYYVDPVSGNDGTGVKNNPALPFRYAQFAVGGANSYTGIWGVGNLKAGDTICLRAGTYSDQAGYDGRFLRFRSHSGSAPTSTASTGPITITAYPGPVLGHAPEYAHYVDPTSGKGGIHGVNSAFTGTAGQWVNISGLHMECSTTSVSDAAPINLQSGGNNWRVVDNELGPWPSQLVSPGNAKAGGIAGQGNVIKILFNYIHDIDCDQLNPGTSALENHGIYLGDAAGICAKNAEIAYNWVKNIPGGSLFQCNNGAAADTFDNIDVHHNRLDTAAKYGINLSNSVASMTVYNNIVSGCGRNSWRIANAQAGAVVSVLHNTFRQNSSSSAYKYIINHETAGMTSGTYKFQHNILVLGGTAGATMNYINFAGSDTAVAFNRNLYFDEGAIKITAPVIDATAIVNNNPNFTNITTADDYTVQTGGAGLDTATFGTPALTVTTDFYGISRPQGANKDIGATEGIGT